jgi:hypothetical protein
MYYVDDTFKTYQDGTHRQRRILAGKKNVGFVYIRISCVCSKTAGFNIYNAIRLVGRELNSVD